MGQLPLLFLVGILNIVLYAWIVYGAFGKKLPVIILGILTLPELVLLGVFSQWWGFIGAIFGTIIGIIVCLLDTDYFESLKKEKLLFFVYKRTCPHCHKTFDRDEAKECDRCHKMTVCPYCGKCLDCDKVEETTKSKRKQKTKAVTPSDL